MKNQIENLRNQLIIEIRNKKPYGKIPFLKTTSKFWNRLEIFNEVVENTLNEFYLEIDKDNNLYDGEDITLVFKNKEDEEPQYFELLLRELSTDLLIEIHNLI